MTTTTTAGTLIAGLQEDLDRALRRNDYRRMLTLAVEVNMLMHSASTVAIAPAREFDLMIGYLSSAATEIDKIAYGPIGSKEERDAQYWSMEYLRLAMRFGNYVEIHDFPNNPKERWVEVGYMEAPC